MTFIDTQPIENCYALAWSYGEICVHCGCCSDDPKVRIPSRIEYAKERIESCENFELWADDEQIRKGQEGNIANDLKFWRVELERLEKERSEL